MGAYDQAIAAGQRALATAGGDVGLHALANQCLGTIYAFQGDYDQAINCFRQAVAFLDGVHHRERFGQVVPPAVNSRAHLTWCYAEQGRFAEGSVLREELLQIAEALDHPASFMTALWGIGLLCLHQGDLHRALPMLERVASLCQDTDLQGYVPRMAPALGTAYILAGRVTAALPLLTQALEQTSARETLAYQALCSLPLSEAHLVAGRIEEAHTLAEGALAHARAYSGTRPPGVCPALAR